MRHVKKILISVVLITGMIAAILIYYKETPAVNSDKEKSQIDVSFPDEARVAAQKGLPRFLKDVSESGQQDAFNFFSQEEIDNTTLGEPFRCMTVDFESIPNISSEEHFLRAIIPTNYIYFPIVSENRIRTMLTVDSMDGVLWEAITIGDTGLARRWASFLEIWPKSNGYEYIYVDIWPGKFSYVILENAGNRIGYVRLSRPEKLVDPSTVISDLKDSIH